VQLVDSAKDIILRARNDEQNPACVSRPENDSIRGEYLVNFTQKLLPTNTWVRLAIVPALAFVALMADRNYLADFWHHLARGRAMAEEGRLVDHDQFTFTIAGQSFQDVNWLSQVMYYRLYQWGGMDLVRVANALVLALTLSMLVDLCWRKSASLPVAAAIGIFTFFGLWQILTVRPQTFSLLLFVLLYDVLDRSEKRPAWLLVPPFILALWANLHGAFPAGIMLIGCFALTAAWQGRRAGRLFNYPHTWRLAICLAVSLLATLINPYGWGIYEYVRQTSGIASARGIDEWGPPTLDFWISKAGLASVIVMVGLVFVSIRRARKPGAREVILVGCFLPMACLWVRMVAWWLIVSAPLAAVFIVYLWPKARDPEEKVKPAWDATLAFAAILVLAVMSLPGLQRYNPVLAGRLAAPRMEEELDNVHVRLAELAPRGRIFTRLEWGEYLTWSFSPHYQVFMDGRVEIYPDKVWQQYSILTKGQTGWEKVLDDYRVDFLLLDGTYHNRTGLLARVEESPHWQRLQQAGPALLYVRTTSHVLR
jgi:hypothetical protein